MHAACGQGRAIAAFGKCQGFLLGDIQRLVGVEYNSIRLAHQAQFLRFHRRGGNLRHGHGLEGLLQFGENITTGTSGLRGTHRDFLQAATRRQQAHAGFHQADVAFQAGNGLGAVHLELAAATQGQTAHCCDYRHQ